MLRFTLLLSEKYIEKILFDLYSTLNHTTTLKNLLCQKKVCTILDAWGWCTGPTLWEGMGREEGRGFRMGNIGIPVVDSFRYLAKVIQYCKV